MNIAQIRQKIVEAQERGECTSALEKQLRQARLEEATKAEVAELQKIASQRLEWQKQADKVQEKVKKQGELITHFLELRDAITGPLKDLIDQAWASGLIKAQNECYEQYHDVFQFGATVRGIPKNGYLPEGFCCPQLIMANGKDYSQDKAAEALYYMQAAYGFLMNLTKGEMTVFQQEVDDGVGHDTENEGDEGQSQSCKVCAHAEVEAINKLLRQGRHLRDIESEFDVSRSSLSRHKAHLEG